MITLAIVLAVLGAGLSAVGVQLQAAGVRDESRDDRLRLRGIRKLLSNPRWLLGLTVLSVCAGLQVLALALAPVTVVAPIVVLALPVIVLLNAKASGVPLDLRTGTAVVASTGGVAVFVGLAASVVSPVAFDEDAVLRAGQYVALAVVGLGVIGAVRHGITRCLALAAGTGAAYGLVSVLVRDVTFTFRQGGIMAVSPLSAAGLVIAFTAGSWFLQLAYASGPPDVVVGCQTVLSPLVATGLGIGVLDETMNAGGWRGIGMVVAGVVAIVGVAVLARHHRPGAGQVLVGHEPGGAAGTSTSASSVR
jgi:drug/metabolite transporter (DMT)-like permease